ncbi:putative serine protease 47 [Hippopotamus amphibius kiboko]|uniref:putative serine protease 47 n=1 Tax=Hippopotamus amphibius kiboko TaxID=575201 RepID=UPI002592890C|nr:putative serine protease 47 [Hippopotamus amphibius kiboko]
MLLKRSGWDQGWGGVRRGSGQGQAGRAGGGGGQRQASVRTLAMGVEAGFPQGPGQPAGVLWLLLLPVATLELRGAPVTATAASGPAAGAGGAAGGGALAPEAQRLAPGATGSRGVSTGCGKPKVMGKIFGGQDVVPGQWPWQASLQYQGSHVCGAVLINSSWLVSTAHCFLKKSHAPENYRVVLGNAELHQRTQHTREMPLRRIITHPDFEKFHPFGSDIAMLQLLFPVNFTSYIIPACLPVPGMQLPSNSSCWITGWGMLKEETPLLESFHLQEGKVGFIENKFCNILYGLRKGKNVSVHEDMLCAGDFSTGKAVCQGDSGGPLVCDFASAWVLMGLASWGLDCRHPIYPSIFTNVTHFTEWIDEVQRLTALPEPMPLPEPTSAPPQTQFPHQSLQAAASPGPSTAFVPPQTLPLLLLVLGALRQALR